MRATHYAINYSDACNVGDGNCDGTVPDGEGNVNALGDTCTCSCHDSDSLPQTYRGVEAWHKAWRANDFTSLDRLEAGDALDVALANEVMAVAAR